MPTTTNQDENTTYEMLEQEIEKAISGISGIEGFAIGHKEIRIYLASPEVESKLPPLISGWRVKGVVTGGIVSLA